MTDTSMKRLKRDELLEMLLELEQENETLAAENKKLHKQLSQRELQIGKVGSLAEASVELSVVFSAAQDAAYGEALRREPPGLLPAARNRGQAADSRLHAGKADLLRLGGPRSYGGLL